jgi:hypothetical protein
VSTRRTARGGGDGLVSPDRRYPLELDQTEVERYRTMAEAARRAEADLWEPAGIVAGARVADGGGERRQQRARPAADVGPDGRVTAVDADPEAVAAILAILPRGHPLGVAIGDEPAAPVGVLMLEDAVDHVGDGLEAPVRMPGGALGSPGASACSCRG